ncbi:MAG: SLATT domain-containing protein [Ignavibacteria bacterium]|nr:SLATT domain-containing protein [Ignavibacteria bacterium]MBI3765964.1 SLATT domain-containing protein [Ignavibacteriales bacterium]
MRDKYLEECKIIQQNSTYTAEAHHQTASVARRNVFWLEVLPAVSAAITGTLVASGVSDVKLLPLTIISASVSAVTAILNPNKAYQEHLLAAKNFTALKHDARFLHEARSANIPDDALALAIQSLHEKYNELLKMVPPCDDKSFRKARAVIHKGIHEPDTDWNGRIK